MPTLTYSLQAAVLNWLKGTPFPTAPTSLKVALLVAAPNSDGSGVIEPNSGSGYTRQTLTLGALTSADGITSVQNSAPVVFGPVTGSNWSPVSYMAVFSNDGTMQFFGALAAQRVGQVGDQVAFAANSIQLRLK